MNTKKQNLLILFNQFRTEFLKYIYYTANAQRADNYKRADIITRNLTGIDKQIKSL